jgi:hypothetical protein
MSKVRHFRFAFGLMALVILLSCTRQAVPTPPSTSQPTRQPSPSVRAVTDYSSFVMRLTAAGLTVESAGQRQANFLSRFLEVPGQGLVIDGEPLAAYEFATEQALRQMRSTIRPQGDTVGRAIISWDPPRFYSDGRLLVVYFGDDERTLDMLRRFLGPKFAGH